MIAESKYFLEKHMFGKSKDSDLREISKDYLFFIDYPGETNIYDFGRVEEIVWCDAKIIFRNQLDWEPENQE